MNIWKHGTYVDMWSVVHFFSGCLLAGFFYRFGYDFNTALLCSIIVLLAWEVFEWTISIIEPSINVIIDIVIGLCGFFLGAYLSYVLQGFVDDYFYVLLGITIMLSLWGFFDFFKRGYR